MLAQLGGGLGWHRGGAADGDTVPVIWAACGSNGANRHPRGQNRRSDLSRRSGMWWPEPMWGCRLVCQVAVTAPGQSGGAAARFRGVTRPSVHRRACRRRCGSSRKLLKALENLRPPHVPLSVVVLPGMGNCYRFVEGPRPSRDHRKTCETSTRKKDFRWRSGVGTAAGECEVILRARNKDEPMLQDKQARSQSRNNGGLRMETQELRSS